jgi:hypothetical protein
MSNNNDTDSSLKLNQRRIKSAPADENSSWSMTDKEFDAAPLGRVQNVIGLKSSIIPIKIIMNTNIPGNHVIEFTSNLLYNPILKNTSNLEKYPLFTNLYKYDEQTIINKPYDKIVNFFFNKKTFIKKIVNYGSLSNIENVNDNNLHNIMVMLKTLFHINETIIEQPIGNSYENKYGSTNKENGLGEQATTIIQEVFNKDKLKNILNISSNDYYSYINVNGEKYTFQRVVWLNDLKSNPFYKKLVNDFIIFNRWLNSTKGSKFKNILENNSFETIENSYNEENKYGKYYGYYNRQNNEKEIENENNKLMINLYSQPEFKKFYEILKTYQNKESKNQLLQDTIELSLSGRSKQVNTNIIGILKNLLSNDENNKNNNNYYYTDILHDTKSDNYEINILADFIKGEMTDEKYKKIKCDFESNKLGDFLEEHVLINKQPFENKNKNTIFSIDENKVIDVTYGDAENEDEIADEKEENKKKGGKRFTNKNKLKRRKTKKNV